MPKPNNENTPAQLLKKALEKIKKAKNNKNPYDHVWIFFDHDNQPNLSPFFQKLDSVPVKIAYSSICIEHWFIIHIENNRRSYRNASQALNQIKKLWQVKFNSQYHKTKINHFRELENMLPRAIKRAISIQKLVDDDGVPMADRNPYFTMHEFIQFFKDL